MDTTKVQALQQKRTIAFVNHFVMTNVQFLNNFMKNCEHKLMMFERKLEKVNAAMVLLESRLSSIPELNTLITDSQPDKPTSQPPQQLTEPIISEVTQHEPPNDTTDPSTHTPAMSMPEYDRFVKMVQVGVPLQAVKLKLSLEGLDPDVLDQILGK